MSVCCPSQLKQTITTAFKTFSVSASSFLLIQSCVLPCDMKMSSSNINLATKTSSEASAVFFCPTEPIFTWILSDKTTFRAAVTISCIACPFTMLLNILVIVTVNKNRRLQNNSNILLASMALADFLVGGVSMPLSISLDALLLKEAVSYSICRIAFANQLVLYAAVCSSLYHMTVIAWERYVAIRKWNTYKVTVTRDRVKRYAGIAWLLAVLTTTPARILMALGVDYKYIKIVDLILTLPAVICLVLIGFFYIMVYLGVRKRTAVKDIREESSRAKAKEAAEMERSIASTTGILTVTLLISYIPSIVVLISGESVPILRTSSFFRWSELLIQLNSLVNPFLYCFLLNRHFRREILKMVTTKKPERIHLLTTVHRRRARRIGVADSVHDSHEFVEQQQQQQDDSFQILRSLEFRDAGYSEEPRQSNIEGSSSSMCLVNHTVCVDVHQPKPVKFEPNITDTRNRMKRGGHSQHRNSQSRRYSQYHASQESSNKISVGDMEVVTQQQNFKTQKPKTLTGPLTNSKLPKPIRLKRHIKVASGVMNNGGQNEGQCSLHYVCNEPCNETDVTEVVSEQAKTTRRPKRTASSSKGNTTPNKNDLELSGTAAKKKTNIPS